MNKNEERNEAGFNWPVVIRNPNARASLDYYYGPYDSVDSMKSSVPNELWVPGFTAAVQSEDGAVEEWWVQGEGAKAGFVKKHEAVIPDGNMRFMGDAGSLEELEAKESPSKGDVWRVSDSNIANFLYIYTGSEWSLLSKNYSLYIYLPEGKTVVYNGLKTAYLNLADNATTDDIKNLKEELKEAYVAVDKLDDLATWQDDGIGLLGKNLSDHKVNFRTPQGNWVYTGITAEQSSISINSNEKGSVSISGGSAKLRLTDKDVGMARNGGLNYYRANPLVLAVRITDYTYKHQYSVLRLYNPFGLDVSIERINNGVYTLTHRLYSNGLSVSSTGRVEDASYVVIGNANVGESGDREHGLFSLVQKGANDFTFRTVRGGSCYDFNTLDLLIFDFNTL